MGQKERGGRVSEILVANGRQARPLEGGLEGHPLPARVQGPAARVTENEAMIPPGHASQEPLLRLLRSVLPQGGQGPPATQDRATGAGGLATAPTATSLGGSGTFTRGAKRESLACPNRAPARSRLRGHWPRQLSPRSLRQGCRGADDRRGGTSGPLTIAEGDRSLGAGYSASTVALSGANTSRIASPGRCSGSSAARICRWTAIVPPPGSRTTYCRCVPK